MQCLVAKFLSVAHTTIGDGKLVWKWYPYIDYVLHRNVNNCKMATSMSEVSVKSKITPLSLNTNWISCNGCFSTHKLSRTLSLCWFVLDVLEAGSTPVFKWLVFTSSVRIERGYAIKLISMFHVRPQYLWLMLTNMSIYWQQITWERE
jgi:hypothetical protein